MLTDVELIELHKNKDYVRQNSFFRNLKYSFKILGMNSMKKKNEDILEGKELWKRVVEEIIWIFIRYRVVTRELVDYRTKIIEGLLSEVSACNMDHLVKDSIGMEYQWLEYRSDKLEIMEKMCLSYFSVPENRMMYKEASNNPASMEKELAAVQDKIHQIFEREINKINRKTAKRTVEKLLPDEQSKREIVDMIMENSLNGNLTGKISRENSNGN